MVGSRIGTDDLGSHYAKLKSKGKIKMGKQINLPGGPKGRPLSGPAGRVNPFNVEHFIYNMLNINYK